MSRYDCLVNGGGGVHAYVLWKWGEVKKMKYICTMYIYYKQYYYYYYLQITNKLDVSLWQGRARKLNQTNKLCGSRDRDQYDIVNWQLGDLLWGDSILLLTSSVFLSSANNESNKKSNEVLLS